MMDLAKMMGMAAKEPEPNLSKAEVAALLAEVKKTHAGPIYGTMVDGSIVLFRALSKREARAMNDGEWSLDPDLGAGTLAKMALLFPTWGELCALADTRPLLIGKLGAEVLRVSGHDDRFNLRRMG